MKNFKDFLLIGLIIIAIVGFIYLIMPKYQVHTVKVDEDYVAITKINTITGEVSTNFKKNIWKRFE